MLRFWEHELFIFSDVYCSEMRTTIRWRLNLCFLKRSSLCAKTKLKHFEKLGSENHNNSLDLTIKKLTTWQYTENWQMFVDAFIAIILPTGPFPSILFSRYTLADHLHLTHYLTKPPESNLTWIPIGYTQKEN